jgi:hypothetical protein
MADRRLRASLRLRSAPTPGKTLAAVLIRKLEGPASAALFHFPRGMSSYVVGISMISIMSIFAPGICKNG